MIKLSKGVKPKVLVDNADQWTNEYVECIRAGKKLTETMANRYRHRDIKSALEKETHKKCAYCESKLFHISHGDIEHILPKNKNARPDLYVEWTNLTLACEICNRKKKKDYYDVNLPLVNPYHDDPEEFFYFWGKLIFEKKRDLRGQKTRIVLDLNRAELVERRDERLKSIDRLFRLWEKEGDLAKKSVIEIELSKECSADTEYSAFVRHFLIGKGFPIK